jgi:hypothetical protein
MKKNKERKYKINILLIVSVFIGVIILSGLLFFSLRKGPPIRELSFPLESKQYQEYSSKNLKISFMYPQSWYLTESYSDVVVTNYPYTPHNNYMPKSDEIKIEISEAVLCNETLDQDIISWGCGEGNQVANTILDKETRKIKSGTFLLYTVLSPQTGKKQRLYYLQNGKRFLQISKRPDSSKFDNEFEILISSIKLL